jgi:exodeoxyribonuclease VII large subunit
MSENPITVSGLNHYISRVLGTDPLLAKITVVGEVSGLKVHPSKHIYFTLKDKSSRVNCFFPHYNVERSSFLPEDGMEIIVQGQVSVYETGGTYSINVSQVQHSGEGDLGAAFQRLKEKLEREGLFDTDYKKPIPFFPQNIGVITSATGAVLHDILSIIQGKNHICNIRIFPSLVQGDQAPSHLIKAIKRVNQDFPDTDLIILGRGGGSLEDLWAFNDEALARAIFQSQIPIISAVGHETDFTISDFVADLRAETPTAAANLSVPDTGELKERIERLKTQLYNSGESIWKRNYLEVKSHDIHNLYRVLIQRIQSHENRLDQKRDQISRDIESLIGQNLMKIDELYNHLDIIEKINTNRVKVESHLEKLVERTQNYLSVKKSSLDNTLITMEDLSPYNVMKRGYAIIINQEGKAVSRVKTIKEKDLVSLIFLDGQAKALVECVKEKENE